MARGIQALIGLVCALALAWPALGQVPDGATLLLAKLELNGQTLDDFEDVMLDSDGVVYLPLETLIRGGEGVYDTIDAGVVRVRLGAHQPQLVLDLDRQQLKLNDTPKPWPDGQLVSVYDRLLVSAPVLADWFALEVAVSADGLSVSVTSQRPLPADLRRLRERRWQRFGQPDFNPDARTYLTMDTPYQLWGTPRGDVRVSMNANGPQGDVRGQFSGRVDVEAAYLTNRLFFSGNETELSSLRWTGGRVSPSGEAFGLPNVYRLEVGDLSGLRLPLVGGSGSGRGVFVSTAPLERPALFDVTEIEGDALPGWDAELYRGQALIDFQSVGDDGRYRFDDVPLGFGSNQLKVVLYGPQGQVETRTTQQNINGGQMRVGEWQAQGSLIQNNKTTFSDTGLFDDTSSGAGGGQFSARVDYGVSAALTTGVFVGLDRSNDLADGASSLAHAGISLRPALGTTSTELVAVTQDNGAMAVQASSRWSWLGVGMSTTLDHYAKGFVSAQRQGIGGALVDTRARLRLGTGLGRAGSVALDYERIDLSNGSVRQEFSPKWRHRWLGANLSHELRISQQAGAQQSQYRFLASKRGDALTMRLQFQAQGAAVSTLKAGTVSFTGDYQTLKGQSLGVGASYAIQSRQLGGSVRVAQRLGPGQLGVSASLNQTGAWSAGLSYSVGLGHDGRRPLGWLTPQQVGGGSVALRVFEDLDGDGVYSEGDRPMPEAGVRVDQRARPDRSDEAGWLIVSGLRTDSLVDIDLDMDTLMDPFLTSARPRVRLRARPGLTHQLTMPLEDSGWISGAVRRSNRPMAGLDVVAERVDGLARETTRTMSDGHFSFETIAPGAWVVYVPDEATPAEWTSERPEVDIGPGQGRDGLAIEIAPPTQAGDFNVDQDGGQDGGQDDEQVRDPTRTEDG
jgi:hypothetical protein